MNKTDIFDEMFEEMAEEHDRRAKEYQMVKAEISRRLLTATRENNLMLRAICQLLNLHVDLEDKR